MSFVRNFLLNSFFLFGILIICCKTAEISRWQNNYGNYKCVDPESKQEYYVGEAFYRPGKCVRVQCLGSLQLWEDGCSVPKLDGNCTEVPGDLSNYYPKCCPKYECRLVRDHGNIQETRIFNHYGNLISNSITQLFVITQT